MPVRRRVPVPLLLLQMAALAGCGPRPPATPAPTAPSYAAPAGGSRAQLTFYVPRVAPGRPQWSAWIYQDARQCRGAAMVARDEGRATDRDVHVAAGQPVTFRLLVRHDGDTKRAPCDATATFIPEPDRHYVADFHPAGGQCLLRLTDYMYQGRGLPAGALAASFTARRPAAETGTCAPGELPSAP